MIHIKNNIVDGIVPDTRIEGDTMEAVERGPYDLHPILEVRQWPSVKIFGAFYSAPILIEWADPE